MANTVEEKFDEYWKLLVEKDSKLAAYPRSYRAAIKAAFDQGYMTGAMDVQLERIVHKEADEKNKAN
jgi:hypothetical protein